MKGVYIKSNTSSFQTTLYQNSEAGSSSSNDADNFENHLKKFQCRKQKKTLINPPMKLLLYDLKKILAKHQKKLRMLNITVKAKNL